MNEITDYLATIDAKVDDVLRGQKDAVVADMIGVGFVIEEAMMIRERVGRVSEVTWSRVSGTAMTIAQTQAYALRQLDGIAVKLECASKMADLAKVTLVAESQVPEWLAVLARCFQLHDAMAVLELDRVLDAVPEELDQHRLGVRAARRDRCQLITDSTGQLLARMDTAAGTPRRRFSCTRPPRAPLCTREIMSRAPWWTSMRGSGSTAPSSRWKRDAGRRRRLRWGTRWSLRERTVCRTRGVAALRR